MHAVAPDCINTTLPMSFTGSRSAIPLALIPPMANATISVISQSRYGPVWPNGVTDVTTSPGRSAMRAPGSRPHPAIVPGVNDSTTRSALVTSERTNAAPAGLERSTTTLSLLVLR